MLDVLERKAAAAIAPGAALSARLRRGSRALVWAAAAITAACGGLPDGADRASQPAEVRQRMGSTEIRVVYNRPSARGRELFGGIVPYNSVWNPGADEATRIETSRDVMIEGGRLPAGAYSLWLIPRPEEWTVIFSRAHDVFHEPYPAGQDALRRRVRPQSGPSMESLSFHFPLATRDSSELVLHWGRVVLPLRIRPVPPARGPRGSDGNTGLSRLPPGTPRP